MFVHKWLSLTTIFAAALPFLSAKQTAFGQVQSVRIPNASYESPLTSFVDLHIDAWQKYPKPPGFPVSDEQWEQGVGLFKNTTNGASDHIDNVDGNQAIYIFNGPGTGVFLDYAATDWAGQTHAFAATFEPGRSFDLTVDVVGGGGNMPEGATLLVSLYYRDASSNMVTLAATPITFTTNSFPTTTHLVDFQVNLPLVKGGDAWAGKNIGISIVSTGPFDKPGGYWDIDNVRLTAAVPTLPLANNSFESPVTPFVDLHIDSWQKFPKPEGFPVTDEQWDQGVGLFKNTAPGASDHIDNMDGNQGVYVFNAPGSGVFQDYDAIDYAGQTHAFSSKFEVGSSYNLTAAVVGGGGNMPEGAALALNFYYRDAQSNIVTIASTPVVHSVGPFPTNTHFVDFQASFPAVKSTDAWADKYIGVAVVSVGPFDKPGGYWDVDNIRLAIGTPSTRLTASAAATNLHLSCTSAPGYQYQLRTSTDLQTWTNFEAPLAGTGSPLTKDVAILPTSGQAFFSVLVTPVP